MKWIDGIPYIDLGEMEDLDEPYVRTVIFPIPQRDEDRGILQRIFDFINGDDDED